MTVRPNKAGYFPELPSPFAGDVALGNMTQWRMQFVRSGSFGIALHIRSHGLAIFNKLVSPADVCAAFPKLHDGDSKNVADFINDQLDALGLGPLEARVGNYIPSLTDLRPDAP